MPFYDYRCQNCGHEVELMQKISDPAATTCPACHQDGLAKMLSAPAVQSGSGGQGHVHGPGCRH